MNYKEFENKTASMQFVNELEEPLDEYRTTENIHLDFNRAFDIECWDSIGM